jgi:hypothetical protein
VVEVKIFMKRTLDQQDLVEVLETGVLETIVEEEDLEAVKEDLDAEITMKMVEEDFVEAKMMKLVTMEASSEEEGVSGVEATEALVVAKMIMKTAEALKEEEAFAMKTMETAEGLAATKTMVEDSDEIRMMITVLEASEEETIEAEVPLDLVVALEAPEEVVEEAVVTMEIPLDLVVALEAPEEVVEEAVVTMEIPLDLVVAPEEDLVTTEEEAGVVAEEEKMEVLTCDKVKFNFVCDLSCIIYAIHRKSLFILQFLKYFCVIS